MPGLLQPWWLIALGVIPLIRWLHRRQAPLSAYDVSAVFIWPDAAADTAPGPQQRPPDPSWRRRALIAGLLVVALAGPTLQRENAVLTVWLDDSLSMQTIEDGETRLAAAQQKLEIELERSDYAEVNRRKLSDALPAQLDDTSAHWLVTDGAGESVRDWASRVQLDRVVTIGRLTENVSLSRLAVRRDIDDDIFDVLVAITNTGDSPAERRVGLWNGDIEFQTAQVSLAPGQTVHWPTRVPAIDREITASLDASDALRDDDELSIAADDLVPVAVSIGPGCGAALRSALAAHPSLRIVGERATASLEVSCPRDAFPDTTNTPGRARRIRALIGDATPVAAAPVWLPPAGAAARLILPPEFISFATWPGPIDADRQRVLLKSGSAPLIAVTEAIGGGTIVDTVIDLRHREFVRQPEYAALLAEVVDIAMGRAVLDAVTVQSRNEAESVIRPGAIDIDSTRSAGVLRTADVPLFRAFVLAALLVLALDIVLLFRSRRLAARA